MKVKTSRFGTLEIEENKIVHFARGIPGFEDLNRFVILPAGDSMGIHWLQAVDSPDIALLLIDPFQYFQGYIVEIPEGDLKELEIQEQSQAHVLTTITVPRDNPGNATANLVAPVIINSRLNRAKQVILKDSPYSTRQRLFPEGKAAGGEGK